MNKPLIGAGAFALAALVFLLYSWYACAGTSTRAGEDRLDWEDSAKVRQQFTTLKQQLTAEPAAKPPRGNPNVPTIMGTLIKECQIDVGQMQVDASGSGPGEKSRHSVRLSGVRVDTMGVLLDKIEKAHAYLVTREIVMYATKGVPPGTFNWNLVIAVPES